MKRNHFTKTVLIFTAVLILLSLAFPALAENSTPAGSALYKLRSAERGRSGTENGGAETTAAPNKDDGRSWNVLDTDEENSDSYYERYCGTGENSQSGCRNMNSRRQGCRGYGRFTDAEDGRGCQNCPYLDETNGSCTDENNCGGCSGNCIGNEGCTGTDTGNCNGNEGCTGTESGNCPGNERCTETGTGNCIGNEKGTDTGTAREYSRMNGSRSGRGRGCGCRSGR